MPLDMAASFEAGSHCVDQADAEHTDWPSCQVLGLEACLQNGGSQSRDILTLMRIKRFTASFTAHLCH